MNFQMNSVDVNTRMNPSDDCLSTENSANNTTIIENGSYRN